MKRIYTLIGIIISSIITNGQTGYNPSSPAGMLRTLNGFSSTLQNVTDKAGNDTPLRIARNRIALGSGTISGNGLLNFPDTSISYLSGIHFGTSCQIGRVSGGYLGLNSNTALQFDVSGGTRLFLTTQGLSISPASLTGSSSISALSITQTYNTTGSPSLIYANLLNTASGANSRLIDLQNGGVSAFSVTPGGITRIGLQSGINWTFSSNTLSSSQFAFITGSNGVILSNGSLSGGLHSNNNGAKVSDNSITTAQLTSSVFEINSTTKGFLLPRMTTTQRDAISSPATGLMVYDITTNKVSVYNGTNWRYLQYE